MAIFTISVSVAAAYAVFHKKINRFAESFATGIKEFAKIMTRILRDKRKCKK